MIIVHCENQRELNHIEIEMDPDQLRVNFEKRLKHFQSACNQKLAEFNTFFNGHMHEMVDQLLNELSSLMIPSGQCKVETIGSAATTTAPEKSNPKNESPVSFLGFEDLGMYEAEIDSAGCKSPVLSIISSHSKTATSQTAASQETQKSICRKPKNHTFQCDICPKMFSVKQSFQIHRRSHTGENSLECDICKRTFNLKQSLAIHMRTHTGERPYMCHLCCTTFKQSAPFRRHMRTHTTNKPHQCPRCDRAFIEKSYLQVHMQSHTGERPHVCPICKRGYTKRYHVRQHLMNLHKVDNVNEVFPPKRRTNNTVALKEEKPDDPIEQCLVE